MLAARLPDFWTKQTVKVTAPAIRTTPPTTLPTIAPTGTELDAVVVWTLEVSNVTSVINVDPLVERALVDGLVVMKDDDVGCAVVKELVDEDKPLETEVKGVVKVNNVVLVCKVVVGTIVLVVGTVVLVVVGIVLVPVVVVGTVVLASVVVVGKVVLVCVVVDV